MSNTAESYVIWPRRTIVPPAAAARPAQQEVPEPPKAKEIDWFGSGPDRYDTSDNRLFTLTGSFSCAIGIVGSFEHLQHGEGYALRLIQAINRLSRFYNENGGMMPIILTITEQNPKALQELAAKCPYWKCASESRSNMAGAYKVWLYVVQAGKK
jgi:hypothetical protein